MMQFQNIIQNNFEPPTIKSRVKDLLVLAADFQISHLPIFENNNLLGMIKQSVLMSLNELDTLETHKNLLERFFLSSQSSLFDIINGMAVNDTNILAIINPEEKYLGYVFEHDAVKLLSQNYFIAETAALVVVSIGLKQFSISEVSKIIESNNGRISGIFVTHVDINKVEISIKFNAANLTSVSETFERFGYKIEQKFFNDQRQEVLKDRYKHLMNYLNL